MIWWIKLREGGFSSAAMVVDSVSGEFQSRMEHGWNTDGRIVLRRGSSVAFILVESRHRRNVHAPGPGSIGALSTRNLETLSLRSNISKSISPDAHNHILTAGSPFGW